MRKAHPLRTWAGQTCGEAILGARVLKTHACYLIYGELAPGEEGRKVCPGAGHEEILLAVAGDIEITEPAGTHVLHEGEAVHVVEEEAMTLANRGAAKAVYILAGGHPGSGHHH
jgi:uncharacterized cupin superfamily protein